MTNKMMETKALELTGESVISVHPEQLSSDLDGETILLQMSSGLYYGLNEMGAVIWEMIQTPHQFKEIQDKLLETYEVTPEVCQQEVTRLLRELHEAGLVEVTAPKAL